MTQRWRACCDLPNLFEAWSSLVCWVCCLSYLVLAGCATGTPTLAERQAALKEFTVEDAQEALAILTAGGDEAGARCLGYLLPKIEAIHALPEPGDTPPDKPLTVLAKIRVAIHGQDTGPDKFTQLDLYCAPLRTSLEIDAAKGAMLGASIAGSGGATAPAALQKVLPILNRLLRPGG